MEDTTISIVGIIIAAIIMFVVPLTLIADRSDDIAQLTAQTVTSNFVDKVIKSGKITNEDYEDFRTMLNTTGNSYDIDMEIKILDTNSAQYEIVNSGVVGQNIYYSKFTTQIEDRLGNAYDANADKSGAVILKEGDVFSVTTKNKSLTLSQSIKNIYYKLRGENLHIIAATASGTVVINGTT